MIRAATREDFPVFREQIREMIANSPAGLFGFDEDAVSDLFEGACRGLVAEHSGKPAGFILFYIAPSMFNPNKLTAMVFLWAVLPEFRGLGIGKSLLSAAVGACKQAGVAGVCIMTTEGAPSHTAQTLGFDPYKIGLIKEV